MITQRQQVIPFTVLSGQTLDFTVRTKYNHSKVTGVVLMPDKNIFGDRIYLEINKQTILPHGFNAGLISFRQFLNKEMKRNVYSFEEYAMGNDVRVIYTNRDKRSVNIDMILFTVQGDQTTIEKRKKLQIVPVQYTGHPTDEGFEPLEIRTKTDFYYDELTGVFNDHFNYVESVFDDDIYSDEDLKAFIRDFLEFLSLPPSDPTDPNDREAKKASAEQLQVRIIFYDHDLRIPKLFAAMRKTLSDYLNGDTQEPYISSKNLFSLQETIETYILYDDGFQDLSTIELVIGSTPFYPEFYPIANNRRYDKRKKKETHEQRLKRLGDNIETVRDQILYGIATGAFKFKWASVSKETGWGQGERKKMLSILDNKGYTINALAHKIWEDSDGSYGRGKSDDVIRDEILDVLQTVNSRSDALKQLDRGQGFVKAPF